MDLDNIKKNENLVAVCATKYFNIDEMNKLYDLGFNNFGENRVQDFLEKYNELKENEDIVWHFIGTLQTNKVKAMINKIDYLHSLDSVKLAKYVDMYRFKPLKCFIEVNVCDSITKFGLNPNEVEEFLENIKEYKNVEVIGLMMMNEENVTDDVKKANFMKLVDLKNKLNEKGYTNISELSMGMSKDYNIAISCGATYVRLGRILKGVL